MMLHVLMTMKKKHVYDRMKDTFRSSILVYDYFETDYDLFLLPSPLSLRLYCSDVLQNDDISYRLISYLSILHCAIT